MPKIDENPKKDHRIRYPRQKWQIVAVLDQKDLKMAEKWEKDIILVRISKRGAFLALKPRKKSFWDKIRGK